MRDNDLAHLRDLVHRLRDPEDTFTRSDSVAFLILLRDSAPPKSMLKDLGHSVAHGVREKGVSFEYLEKYSLHLRRWLIHGGTLQTNVMFPIGTVIKEINSVLSNLLVAERLDGGPTSRFVLSTIIADVLDGTSYKLRVATGRLAIGHHADDGRPVFLADIQFDHDIDGFLKVRADQSVSLKVRADQSVANTWMIGDDEVQTYRANRS